MALKVMYVIVNYNPTTKKMTSVNDPGLRHGGQPMTYKEAVDLCASLNPDKGIRHRVGTLTVEEDEDGTT